MGKSKFIAFSYILLVTITCLSFGVYIFSENFKPKSEKVSKDFAEEKTESYNETSKELTKSFLITNMIHFNYTVITTPSKYPSITLKIASFSVKPSTPPPDLLV